MFEEKYMSCEAWVERMQQQMQQQSSERFISHLPIAEWWPVKKLHVIKKEEAGTRAQILGNDSDLH